MQEKYFDGINDVPEDVLFGRDLNGWTDVSKAFDILKHSFRSGSPPALNTSEEQGYLMFDEYSTHLSD